MTTWRGVRRTAAMTGIMGAAVVLAAAAQESPFQWSGELREGRTLEVRGISGSIRAERASGGTAEVVAEKTGRSSDYDQVEVRVEERSDRVIVCAVYRPERYASDGCDLSDRDSGRTRRGERDIRVGVDFVVRVPDGAKLVASQVSGDVEALGLRADVEASAVSGDVTVSTTGVAEAESVSGSLDIEMGSLDWTRLDFETVSGDITLRLPEGLSTDIEFESINGDLDTDFSLQLTGRQGRRWVGSHVRGTIGEGGGRSLTVETVSGDLRILRAR